MRRAYSRLLSVTAEPAAGSTYPAGADMDVLVGSRNQHVMDVLGQQAEAKASATWPILFGAAHMVDLEHRLLTHGYTADRPSRGRRRGRSPRTGRRRRGRLGRDRRDDLRLIRSPNLDDPVDRLRSRGPDRRGPDRRRPATPRPGRCRAGPRSVDLHFLRCVTRMGKSSSLLTRTAPVSNGSLPDDHVCEAACPDRDRSTWVQSWPRRRRWAASLDGQLMADQQSSSRGPEDDVIRLSRRIEQRRPGCPPVPATGSPSRISWCEASLPSSSSTSVTRIR